MPRSFRLLALACRVCALAAAGAGGGGALAQSPPPATPSASPPSQRNLSPQMLHDLMQTRVSNLFPGGVSIDPDIPNPVAGQTGAVEHGMQHFEQFNCVGCHAPNGAGGMGPSLSDDKWIYGSTAADLYLTIVHGRPNGMPAFGALLPDQTVWELVAYIQSIAEKPQAHFGKTTSRSPQSPKIEQVPVEMMTTTTPWQRTEPFSNGQPPKSEQGVEQGGKAR